MKEEVVEKPPKKKQRKKSKQGGQPDKQTPNMAASANVNNDINSLSSQQHQPTYTQLLPSNQCIGPTGIQNYQQMPNQPSPYGIQQSGQFFQASPPQNTQAPAWAQDLISKVDFLTSKLNKLDDIDSRLSVLDNKIDSVNRDVNTVKNRVEELEKSTQFISETFDELSVKTDEAVSERTGIKKEIVKLTIENKQLREDITDMQARSMRDNLLFFGLKEDREENCTDVVLDFCENVLEMTNAKDRLEIDRAHRLGKFKPDKTRPIVVKFNKFTQREEVRKNTKKLEKTGYGIGQQFPKEIQERRKVLVPVLKRAKENNKKAFMVRDKLYIEGQLYTGDNQTPTKQKSMVENNTSTRGGSARGQGNRGGRGGRGGQNNRFSTLTSFSEDMETTNSK